MAKRAKGLRQQVAADAVGMLLRSAQRIDRGELQPQWQQQQRGRAAYRCKLAAVWGSIGRTP
jgi:hypothetical protein